MAWYENKLKGRNEKLEKEFYEVFGAIENAKSKVHEYIKFVKKHPAHSYENGGTVYTSEAIKKLEKAQELIGKYKDYQIKSTKEGRAYADKIEKKYRKLNN